MDSGTKNSNNKFVESGRKSQSESRKKILEYRIKRKKLYMHTYRKYPWSCPSSKIESTKFFSFTAVFLPPFSLFLSFFSLLFPLPFSYFFSFPPFCLFFLFVLYTTVFTPISPSTCESGVQSFSVPFRPSLNLLLLAVRLLVHCSVITSTLMRPKSQLGSI